MQITRRQTMVAGGAAFVGANLPALAADPLRFATLSGQDFMLPFVTQDAGFFKKNGLDVDIQIATQAPNVLSAVVGGSLQFGVSTGIQVAIANEAGLDVVIVSGAGILSKRNVGTAIVVRSDLDFKDPKDFIGKKVMAPGINGAFYMLFLRYLKQGGVDPQKVTIVEGGFAQMPDLLRSKQVDAVLSTEPFLTRMVSGGVGKRLDYFIPEREYYFSSFFIAKRSWIDSHKSEFEKVLSAMQDGVAQSRSDPATTLSSIAKHLKLPPEVMAKQELSQWRVDVKPEDVQFWADLALEFGLLQAPLDARRLLV